MKIKLLSAALLSLLLAACGGSSDKFVSKPQSSSSSSSAAVLPSSSSTNSQSSTSASSVSVILTGVLLDSPVQGIGYKTETQEGVTNEDGEFQYQEGEWITFFIGNLEFPAVEAAHIVTPLNIANTDDINDHQVINIIRLLQSLDTDGDASNGLTISAEAIAIAETLDFTVDPQIFADSPELRELLQNSGGVHQELIPVDVALAHFQQTLDALNASSSSSAGDSTSSEADSSSSSEDSTSSEADSSSSSEDSTSSEADSSSSSEDSTSSEADSSSSVGDSTSSEADSSSSVADSSSSEAASSTSSDDSTSSTPAENHPALTTWGFNQSAYASFLGAVSGGNFPVTVDENPRDADGLVIFLNNGTALRFREDGRWNFNGHGWIGADLSTVPAVGTEVAAPRAYLAVPVNTGRAFTLDIDWQQSASASAQPVAGGKIVLLSQHNQVIASQNILEDSDIYVFSANAGHTLTEVRILYSREGANTGGMHIGALARSYDDGTPPASSSSSSEDSTSSEADSSSSEADSSSSEVASSSSSEDSTSSEADSSSSVGDSTSSEADSSSSVADSSSSEADSSSSVADSSSSEAASSSSAEDSSSSEAASSSSAEDSTSSEADSSSSVADSSSSEAAESSASSESSSSEASAGIVNTPLPIIENFDSVVDAEGFFSVGYKALETEEAPFYHAVSGSLSFADGTASVSNVRVTLGNTTPTISTSTNDLLTETMGELDLSQEYRVSFCVITASGTGNLQVLVDNNTTGQGNSAHGNPSRIFSQSAASLVPGQRVVINSNIGTVNSFLMLRAESSAQVVIDDLWIGYQNDTDTEPLGDTCIPPAPVAPAAPILTAGDEQISVSWSAVSGATGYEVIYNTVDSTDGAIPLSDNPVTATSATITGLTNGTTYYVFVRASNASGDSDYSVGVSATPEEPEVGAPGSWVGAALDLAGSSGSAIVGSVDLNQESAITITASGGDVGSTVLRTYYAYQEGITVPFTYTARLASVTKVGGGTHSSTGNSRRYGIMVMENLNSAAFVDIARFSTLDFYASNNTPVFAGSRAEKVDVGAGSSRGRSDVPGMAIGDYLRIRVAYEDVDGVQTLRARRSYSANGAEFTAVGNDTQSTFLNANGNPLSTTWYVGVFASPHQDELTLVFDNISITQE